MCGKGRNEDTESKPLQYDMDIYLFIEIGFVVAHADLRLTL